MKLVIDIDEKTYNEIMDDAKNTQRNLSHYEWIIARGAPLPKEQEQKYCDRNICLQNDYNGIGCDECEVTKSQEIYNDAKQTAIDLEELRHRFGNEVAFVVEDMIKGTSERWSCSEKPQESEVDNG